MKANAPFEPLEGVAHMILALGVYLRPKGTDEDWRGGMIGILEVSTLADEETIKKLPIYIYI